jgi:hypothetical protein
MQGRRTAERAVNVFDHVSIDGKTGLAVGFYAREERIVVVRLDAGGVIEVPESQVLLITEHEELGWPKSMRGRAGRLREEDVLAPVWIGP